LKPHRIPAALAALGLLAAAAIPAPTTAAGPTAANQVATQAVQITFVAVLCPSYTVVPANKNPTNFDQTGGHGAQLDTRYQTALVNPATDIPGVCRLADGWQFQMYGDPGLTTPVGSTLTSGNDGANSGTATVTLDAAELALAQTTGAPTGLWMTELTQPSEAGFGAFRCYNDINNGDDAENLQGVGASSLHAYCIAYNVVGPSTYHPLNPTRILDTRTGTGGLSGPFSSHTPRTFTVVGQADIPADAAAVTGNLTVTGQTSQGFLYIGPVATANPGSSNLNFPVHDNRANAVTVSLGSGGTLSITYVAPTLGPTTQVIFDVSGYFAP
jgi:hypothetical protein